MSRVFEKLREGRPALGILIRGGLQLVDYIAQAKFDFIIPDMMFTGMDWGEVNNMVRAAHASGIGCYPRIQAFPWASTEPDRRLAVDTARALSLKADGVCMSVNGAEEVRQIVTTTADWHRGVAVTSGDQLKEHEEAFASRTLLLPLIEEQTAIDKVDEIIDVAGLTGIFIAWTDFAKQLGYPLQYEHPEVLKVVERIIAHAHKRKLLVAGSVGSVYADTEASAQRILRMWNMGVHLIDGKHYRICNVFDSERDDEPRRRPSTSCRWNQIGLATEERRRGSKIRWRCRAEREARRRKERLRESSANRTP